MLQLKGGKHITFNSLQKMKITQNMQAGNPNPVLEIKLESGIILEIHGEREILTIRNKENSTEFFEFCIVDKIAMCNDAELRRALDEYNSFWIVKEWNT